MTNIEQKALALVNEVCKSGFKDLGLAYRNNILDALLLAIEQHEAFRQEVSDVASVCAQHFCENSWTVGDRQDHVDMLHRFIIPAPKPDPLVDIVEWLGGEWTPEEYVKEIRAALDARGLEIREKKHD